MTDSRAPADTRTAPVVGLLVTCLVDLYRPSVAEAAVLLLERAGFSVRVPAQTCCGQPNFNGGDREGARAMARQMITAFRDYELVVAPSGSCVAMVREYPGLFDADTPDRAAAESLARRTRELTDFLHSQPASGSGRMEWAVAAAYHDACSGLRKLGIRDQPRKLLSRVAGLDLREPAGSDECCGFGGTFCVKYPDISVHMADARIADITATGADYVIGGDLGCLLHLEGRLQRRGLPVRAVHVAEALAGVGAAAVRDGTGDAGGRHKR